MLYLSRPTPAVWVLCHALCLTCFIFRGRTLKPTAICLAPNSTLTSDLWAWFTILSLRGPQLPPAPPARLLPAAVRPELASVHRRSAHTPERLCSRWRGALSELQSCLWNPDPLPSKPGLSLEQGALLYIQARSRPLQLPSWCSSAEMWPTDCSCSGGLRKSPNSDLIVQSLNIKGRLCIVQTSVKAFPINFEDNNSVLLEKT